MAITVAKSYWWMMEKDGDFTIRHILISLEDLHFILRS